jgi:hypothetical protein
MGGMEFGIALFTGLIGYGAFSFGRRYLAAKNPGASGSIAGVMGEELAPMDWKQWLLGIGLTAAPLIGGHFIKNVPLRSVVQGFGFGAGIGTFGKALDDGLAMLTKSTQIGALVYAPELSGQAFRAQQAPSTSTNTTGTSGLPECTTCGRSDGLGKCCRSSYAGAPNRMDVTGNPPSVPPAQAQPPIQAPPPPQNLTPREIPVPPAPPPSPQIPPPPVLMQNPLSPQVPGNNLPGSPPAAPMSPIPASPLTAPVGVRGFPRMNGLQNHNWGHPDD